MSTEENIEKTLRGAIQQHEKNQLKARLQQLEKQGGKTVPLRLIWATAAAAVILLLFVIGLMLFKPAQDGQALYASHFEPYPNALEPVTRGADTASLRMQAFEAYESGDYSKAIADLQQLLTQEENPDLRFYLAMSLMNDGQYEAALTELQRLKDADTRFAAQALWYRALLEIRTEQRETASQTLQELLQAKPAYKAPEAQELLEAL